MAQAFTTQTRLFNSTPRAKINVSKGSNEATHRCHYNVHLSRVWRTRSASLYLSPFRGAPITGSCRREHLRDNRKASFRTLVRCSSAAAAEAVSYRNKEPKDINVAVFGSTGYIGKFVVKELMSRGFNVISIARKKAGIGGSMGEEEILAELKGADVRFGNVTDPASLEAALGDMPIDAVVSCLASRRGGKKDSWDIDYQATRNSLNVGRAHGAKHFVLLSAICVQKPTLEFQRAKLKFEEELQAAGDITFSIVRPTAFFKSLGGQVETVKGGGPYVMFGDGQLCSCKPISEADLASFMADCIVEEDKVNKVLPIGGPGKAYTPLEQGQLLFGIVGKEPKFFKVPIEFMDFVINVLDFFGKFVPSMVDAAEYGRIGRYYASESMLVLDPATGKYSAELTPSYGKDTLPAFFKQAVEEGMRGQELGEQALFSK